MILKKMIAETKEDDDFWDGEKIKVMVQKRRRSL